MTQTAFRPAPTGTCHPGPGAPAARRGAVLNSLLVIGVSIVGGLALGAWTARAQGWLPFELAPLANSSGSWALIAFGVALLARRAIVAAIGGALTLGALVAGYYGAFGVPLDPSVLTGHVGFWGVIAVLAGPLLGLAAHALRSGTGLRAALGLAAMSGVLIGEGISSLMRIADTTSVTYWQGEVAAGVVLFLLVAILRLRPAAAGVAVLATASVAGAFVTAYGVAPLVLGQL